MANQSTTLDSLAELMIAGFETVNDRFDGLEGRMDGLDARMGGIETRMGGLESFVREAIARLEGRITGIESDIKEIYERLVALEKRWPDIRPDELRRAEADLSALMEWAEAVSKKLDIPLPKS